MEYVSSLLSTEQVNWFEFQFIEIEFSVNMMNKFYSIPMMLSVRGGTNVARGSNGFWWIHRSSLPSTIQQNHRNTHNQENGYPNSNTDANYCCVDLRWTVWVIIDDNGCVCRHLAL